MDAQQHIAGRLSRAGVHVCFAAENGHHFQAQHGLTIATCGHDCLRRWETFGRGYLTGAYQRLAVNDQALG
jgi:hypothetical protein